MKTLLIGGGAREHAMAEALVAGGAELVCISPHVNPGISGLGTVEVGDITKGYTIKKFAKVNKIELAVIGPEAPLAAGVADELEGAGILVFGPKKQLAQLETSKGFTRMLQQKYGIAGAPRFKIFEKVDGVEEFLRELGAFVVKPDGLTGGKGVRVFGEHLKTVEDGVSYSKEILVGHPRVVIEEKLEGEEFSLQCFVDGKTVVPMPAVQDHKRAFEGDVGPNTGGMGSYSDANHLLPFLSPKDAKEALKITREMMLALGVETGEYYRGVMYGGFMATADGVRLIEYNARFGDPEAMNVLPLLKANFADVCRSVARGSLSKQKISFDRRATVCKYVVPNGYPVSPVKNGKVEIGPLPKSVRLYYASATETPEGLRLGSSRGLACVGIADSIDGAELLAEAGIQKITGDVFHRSDIGTAALLKKRIDHMRLLRPRNIGP